MAAFISLNLNSTSCSPTGEKPRSGRHDLNLFLELIRNSGQNKTNFFGSLQEYKSNSVFKVNSFFLLFHALRRSINYTMNCKILTQLFLL